MKHPWKSVGVVASVVALSCLGLTAAETPPSFNSLTREVQIVDGPARLVKPPKGRTVAVITAGGAELFIRNVCNGTDCRVPQPFDTLAQNQRVLIWRHDQTIWQAQTETSNAFTYRSAVAAMNSARAGAYLFYAGLLVAGVLAVLLGGRRGTLSLDDKALLGRGA